MYVVVDFQDGELLWSDTRVCNKKSLAVSRMEFFKKKHPNKNYRVIRFTQYKVAV